MSLWSQRTLAALTVALSAMACAGDVTAPDIAAIQAAQKKITPLHEKKVKPGPNDWLAKYREPGQTFAEYIAANPPRPTDQRKIIYLQPLGDFTKTQERLVDDVADFMGRFYGLKVQKLDALPLKVIPDDARRVHPRWGDKQIRSTYVLDLLAPRLPKDAMALLALTASDLFPEDSWNYVFGQASLQDRVGVWSFYRYGDPEKDYTTVLDRVCKVATHETGHMFGIQHCTAYECGMNGTNHLEEADGRPVEFCPDCVAKLWWACGMDPAKRYGALAEFATAHKMEGQAKRWKELQAVLTPGTTTEPRRHEDTK